MALLIIVLNSDAQTESTRGISKTFGDLIVFTECEPVNEYEVLDEINITSLPASLMSRPPVNYVDVRNLYIRAVNKMNLSADGIIFTLNNSGVSSAVIISFIDNSIANDTSIVSINRGLYCFVDSEPIDSFKKLGPVINKLNLYNVPFKIAREGFLKRCNKQFPKAQGVVFNFKLNAPNSANAIEFN